MAAELFLADAVHPEQLRHASPIGCWNPYPLRMGPRSYTLSSLAMAYDGLVEDLRSLIDRAGHRHKPVGPGRCARLPVQRDDIRIRYSRVFQGHAGKQISNVIP